MAYVFKSPAEEAFWLAYEQNPAGLAGLVPQVQAGPYWLDFALPHRRFGIEVDGLAYHNGQETFVRDRKRQRELELHQWRIVRFAAKEVLHDPDGCVREAAALATALLPPFTPPTRGYDEQMTMGEPG